MELDALQKRRLEELEALMTISSYLNANQQDIDEALEYVKHTHL